MFYTDDVKGNYERIKARGAEFATPPTDVTGSTIAMLNDTNDCPPRSVPGSSGNGGFLMASATAA